MHERKSSTPDHCINALKLFSILSMARQAHGRAETTMLDEGF